MKLSTAVAFVLLASADALNIKKAFRFGKKSLPKSAPAVASQPIQAKNDKIAPAPAGSADMPDKDISNIFAQNAAWREARDKADPEFFKTLGTVHKPKYLYIGCVDARVPPNMIMGEDAGSMLTVRNIANMVVNNDLAVMSAIQFGINVLQIPHVILCGHYECGGVKASVANVDHQPPLSIWLRNIRDVYRLHQKELDAIKDPDERHRRLVDLNVIEQCVNLFKTGVIQKKRIDTFNDGAPYAVPRVHPVVFDPATGELKKLQVDFEKYMKELNGIYDLYDLEAAKVPN